MKRDILYVDDELDNIVVFQAGFEDDFNVWTATSGQEALDLLDSVPMPVVVADQRMPGMTGVELCEILRRKHPHTKRILLTGYTDSAAMLESINKGQVFHFVKKPWERDELQAILIRALEAHDLEMANLALTDRLVASERCATLGQAAARIAHEMGNQLALLPLLEHIEDHYRHCPDLIQFAQLARQTHERLVALVEEVKGFVRFEQQRFPRCAVRLAPAIQELIAFLRFDKNFPQDRLTLKLETEPVVWANKMKLQQVLINLIKNASQAIRDLPDGRITVTLRREASHAMIAVEDNGCGMTREMQQRIWEPFFSTKGAAGNGLGLSISRQLIESHGGTITCESEPGCGAVFTIRLPLLQPSQAGESENGDATRFESCPEHDGPDSEALVVMPRGGHAA